MSVVYGPFEKKVAFKPRSHQYVRQGQILKGITKPIEKAFHPNWKFWKAQQGPEHCEDVDRRKQARTPQQGMNKGKKVDAQISRVLKFMKRYKLSLRQFVKLKDLPEKKRNAKNAQAIHLSKTMLSNTRELLLYWAKRGLKLVATQLPVGSDGVGTGLDVVLEETKDEYIIVNVKTNAWKNYDKHTGKCMEYPYGDIKDSVRNHNQLQILTELILFYKTYQGKKAKAEVHCVDATGKVRPHALEKWAVKKQDEFWAKLVSTARAMSTGVVKKSKT